MSVSLKMVKIKHLLPIGQDSCNKCDLEALYSKLINISMMLKLMKIMMTSMRKIFLTKVEWSRVDHFCNPIRL